MDHQSTLERFVRDAFGHGDGLLLLSVIASDGSRMACNRWDVGRDVDDAYKETFEQIEERALRQANALGGTHAFILEWYRQCEGERPRVEGHEVFRVSAETAPGGRFMSEPANEGGLVAQAMRHQETNQKHLSAMFDRAMHHMGRTLDRISERAEKAETRYVESMGVFLESIANKQAHEVELVKAQGNAEVKAQLAGRVATLIPAMAGRVMEHFGKEGFQVRLRGFFETLKPEQFGGILQQLQPEQQALLLEMAKPIIAELEEEKARAGKDGVH